MLLHEVKRGSIVSFEYWSVKHQCWKGRTVVVVKHTDLEGEPIRIGRWKTLGRDLGNGGKFRTFYECRARNLASIYIVAAEKTEQQARAFARGFSDVIGPEWTIIAALADHARVVHGFGPPHAVLAVEKELA